MSLSFVKEQEEYCGGGGGGRSGCQRDSNKKGQWSIAAAVARRPHIGLFALWLCVDREVSKVDVQARAHKNDRDRETRTGASDVSAGRGFKAM